MIRGPDASRPKLETSAASVEEHESELKLEPKEVVEEAEEAQEPESRTRRLLAVTDRQIAENADRLRAQNNLLRQHFHDRQDAEKERVELRQAQQKSLFGVTKTHHRSGATGETVEVTKQVDLDRRTTMAASVKVIGPSEEDKTEPS